VGALSEAAQACPQVLVPGPGDRQGTRQRVPQQGPQGHCAWYVRYSAPVTADGKRPRILLGPYATERECTDALLDALGKIRSGRHADDRRTRFGEYLDRRLRWWGSEADIKPSTLASYREAIDLYFKPGLGHERLVDLRDHHFRDLATAMRKINTPAADSDLSDMLRRLLGARATRDGKPISTRPLTDARIRRILAVASSALAPLLPNTLPVNPAANVKAGKARRRKPLLWTAARVERWRDTGEIPAPVMVWSREHCGAFLDTIQRERLYALFELAAYTAMRRSELAGLCWPDVDLASRRIHVRQAQVDDELDSTKSEDSERIISLDKNRAETLKAWRKASSRSGSPGAPSGRTRAGYSRGKTGRRCGPPGSASGSTRSPPASACRRSPCTASGTARRRCCWPLASRPRSSVKSWATPPPRSRWTSTPRWPRNWRTPRPRRCRLTYRGRPASPPVIPAECPLGTAWGQHGPQ
jgi:integrase